MRSPSKRASILIVTSDGLVYTRLCLESLLANTDDSNYEVIVVDNASVDGTPTYLRDLAQRNPQLRVVLNECNRGFAPANNQALALATGDVLVLLNNDTIVPPGWLMRLVQHLDDPTVGLLGPVTNRICNEAQIDVSYRTYGEFVQFTHGYIQARTGQLFDIPMAAMFCLAMRREVYERVGPLDERFEVGMFEDDDYAIRARAAGYRVVCAEDVLIHHFGQASFGHLVASGEFARLFQTNRTRFEEKWGITWEQHRRRPDPQYIQLGDRIRSIVQTALPTDAIVIVVSKGDDELLKLNGRPAHHFPQTEDGAYAGHYPVDSDVAITQLESLRAKGAEFLLFPSTAFWWLDHYKEFKQHLESKYEVLVHQEDTCLIFTLRDRSH